MYECEQPKQHLDVWVIETEITSTALIAVYFNLKQIILFVIGILSLWEVGLKGRRQWKYSNKAFHKLYL